MENEELIQKIRRKEIDINNQSLFFRILIKGFLRHINEDINIRGKKVPHYILNTGDETMMLEVKGQSMQKDVPNEDYIYTTLPRCAVTPKGISINTDQLTSPYSYGMYQVEYDDKVISCAGEFRRIPLTMSFDLSYLVDSYTDFLELMQQIVSKKVFVNDFNIVYMGQTLHCSYSVSDSYDGEHMIEFDEATTDDRRHKLETSIELETSFPVFDVGTTIETDKYITHTNFDSQRSHIVPRGGIDRGLIGEDPHQVCEHKEYQIQL